MLWLEHMVGSCCWKKEHYKTEVSNIFTLSDEVFAFLVLGNNIKYC